MRGKRRYGINRITIARRDASECFFQPPNRVGDLYPWHRSRPPQRQHLVPSGTCGINKVRTDETRRTSDKKAH